MVVEFNIMHGKGISRVSEILDLAVQFDIIQNEVVGFGTRETIGQGADSAMQFLEKIHHYVILLSSKLEST